MKRVPGLIVIAVAVLVAALCVRLGFWQLSRLAEKQALNARLRTALAAPPRPLPPANTPAESLATSRFAVSGWFDEKRQILLVNRVHGGEPGVEIVTPLRPSEGGEVVLVNRGWVPAADAATAHPADYPAPGLRTAVGLLTGIHQELHLHVYLQKPDPPLGPYSDSGQVQVRTTPRLDFDSVYAWFPYPVRGVVLRELAAPGDPPLPARAEARPYDETIHRSYAAQWFLFGTIALVGPVLLLRKRRPRPE